MGEGGRQVPHVAAAAAAGGGSLADEPMEAFAEQRNEVEGRQAEWKCAGNWAVVSGRDRDA